MASSSSPSSPPASPSHTNPTPHDDADPRSDPPMPAASDGDGDSPASPDQHVEEPDEAASGKDDRDPPAPPEETPTPRKTRLPRACNSRPRPPPPPPLQRPRRRAAAGAAADETPQCRVVTPLVSEPEAPAELPCWRLRCMWELGSVLNFLHVFRPLLNITEELTAEDLEAALITPNGTLYDVHMPLLKSIPPITRMAMGRGTWVTVLCRKLRDWWHWVAEGDLPIFASHGAEIEMYNELEPATRLVILKAICDIRVEQEDIRNHIDSSIKRGYDLCTFRKERIGGDSLGISYWYEDDPILGHRLYREIRRVEQVKKEPGKRTKGKGDSTPPVVSYQWETVASTFDEFDDVAEKLFSSRNRTEVSLGKKLKIEYLPEIEKIHKKEKSLKKQQREALLLDSYLTSDVTTGRSLRDRKPVTYTFDDYDRSINEAIKITKKGENSGEPVTTLNRRMFTPRPESSSNGKLNGPSPLANELTDGNSSKSDDYRDSDGEEENETLDRSNRRRRRSQRYTRDFVEAVSDIDPNFSDDDIMGEAVYDEEYLRTRKYQKTSSASEEDEEFRLEEDVEDEDEDEEEEEFSAGTSEDIEEPQRHKKLRSQNGRGAKLRSVGEIQKGLRRSKRSSRLRINYQQYDFSDTDAEAGKAGKSDASDPDANSDGENNMELSTSSQEQQEEEDDGTEELKGSNGNNKMDEDHEVDANKEEQEEEQPQLQLPSVKLQSVEKTDVPSRESESVGRTFLDLNELAPGGGFDDGPSLAMKDGDMDNS